MIAAYNKIKKFALGLLLALLSSHPVFAQPFIEEIKAFAKQDSISFPGTGHILFIGSSSFTLWKDVQDYFPAKKIVNRGFGGASLPDLIRYADRVIFPYRPRKVVIYCGENDIASSDTISPSTVAARFTSLFVLIRRRLPSVPIVFVSLKPSPSRAHIMPRVAESNHLIKQFLKTQKYTVFVDVYHAMLDTTGRPLPHIFLKDSLHMNAAGYRIWQKALNKYL
jgi:lysophospholipase L1-like esterase